MKKQNGRIFNSKRDKLLIKSYVSLRTAAAKTVVSQKELFTKPENHLISNKIISNSLFKKEKCNTNNTNISLKTDTSFFNFGRHNYLGRKFSKSNNLIIDTKILTKSFQIQKSNKNNTNTNTNNDKQLICSIPRNLNQVTNIFKQSFNTSNFFTIYPYGNMNNNTNTNTNTTRIDTSKKISAIHKKICSQKNVNSHTNNLINIKANKETIMNISNNANQNITNRINLNNDNNSTIKNIIAKNFKHFDKENLMNRNKTKTPTLTRRLNQKSKSNKQMIDICNNFNLNNANSNMNTDISNKKKKEISNNIHSKKPKYSKEINNNKLNDYFLNKIKLFNDKNDNLNSNPLNPSKKTNKNSKNLSFHNTNTLSYNHNTKMLKPKKYYSNNVVTEFKSYYKSKTNENNKNDKYMNNIVNIKHTTNANINAKTKDNTSNISDEESSSFINYQCGEDLNVSHISDIEPNFDIIKNNNKNEVKEEKEEKEFDLKSLYKDLKNKNNFTSFDTHYSQSIYYSNTEELVNDETINNVYTDKYVMLFKGNKKGKGVKEDNCNNNNNHSRCDIKSNDFIKCIKDNYFNSFCNINNNVDVNDQ